MAYSEFTHRAHRRALDAVRRGGLIGRIFHDLAYGRAEALVRRMSPYVRDGSCLDVGCGTGHVAAVLQRTCPRVVGADLQDLRAVDVPFVEADARRLPFDRGAFDSVLLVTVLHHVDGDLHRAILAEAVRVAGRCVVLVEDVFQGRAERLYVKLMDRVYNLDFGPHPHSNRRTAEWGALLGEAGCRRVEHEEQLVRFAGMPMRQAVIVGYVA